MLPGFCDRQANARTTADTSGGVASALACDLHYLVAVLFGFDSAFHRLLSADAEFFVAVGALKLGGHTVSIPSPFDSDPKFIHGIVSR